MPEEPSMTTISASSSIGINLNSAFYTSPVVIGAGVTISNPNYPNAVYTPTSSSAFFVIQNNGAIYGSASLSGDGVYLAPGGAVTNAAAASIYGSKFGVAIEGGAGTVVNAGGITGATGVSISGAGTVVNDGSITGTSGGFFQAGVYLSL